MSAVVVSSGDTGSGSTAVAHPLPDDLVELIADRFRALAEPMRIKLLDQLREGEASVLELTELVGTTQQNVSKHLVLLQRAGLVARRKQGNFAYYSIADDSVFKLCEAVCGSLQDRFETLRRVTRAS
jgi:DNA-binding transcriptional ArsR family regulator